MFTDIPENPSRVAAIGCKSFDRMCSVPYTEIMKKLQVLKTQEFEKWLSKLQPKLRAIVTARLDLLSVGHFGDHKRFDGLIELRWRNGTRVYSFMWGEAIVVALNGGNKKHHNKNQEDDKNKFTGSDHNKSRFSHQGQG